MRLMFVREKDAVECLLLPHKDGSGYSYINLTKGHICPCKFSTIDEALEDAVRNSKVKSFQILEEI